MAIEDYLSFTGRMESEIGDLLRFAVLKHGQIARLQVTDQLSLSVGGHHVNYYEASIGAESLIGVDHILWLVRSGLGFHSHANACDQ
jgi:hypothetical protein